MSLTIKNILAKAVIRILTPLVYILMRNDFAYKEFAELARRVYVQVAFQKFTLPDQDMTYSRASVLTGLSRKEVVRLYKASMNEVEEKTTPPNRALRVINGWMQDADYVKPNGESKSLSLYDGDHSFSELVTKYAGDIRPKTVFDELTRMGVITVDDSGLVTMVSQGYIPHEDEIRKLDLMSTHASDLLSSALHNVENGMEDARFQRQVTYHEMTDEIAYEFKKVSHEKAEQLITEMNAWLGKKKQALRMGNKLETKRIGLGIYYFDNLSQEFSDENGNEETI